MRDSSVPRFVCFLRSSSSWTFVCVQLCACVFACVGCVGIFVCARACVTVHIYAHGCGNVCAHRGRARLDRASPRPAAAPRAQILAANNESVLSRYAFDSEDLSLPLNFTPAAAASRMFGAAPAAIVSILGQQSVTENLHHDGVTPDTFNGNAQLSGFYNMLSTNDDRVGKVCRRARFAICRCGVMQGHGG